MCVKQVTPQILDTLSMALAGGPDTPDSFLLSLHLKFTWNLFPMPLDVGSPSLASSLPWFK